jgi:hypothetical protein
MSAAIIPAVEAMGLDWNGQYQRLKRDPILSEGMCVTHIPFGRGGGQECVCLNVELIQGWLFTIDTLRIKDENVRRKVQMYQRECYAVLHAHFTGKVSRTIEGDPAEQPTLGERLRLVTETRQSFDTTAARQMWFAQNLPVVPAMLNRPEQMTFDYSAIKQETEAA